MKTALTLVLLVAFGMLGCKAKGPLVEPKDNPVLSTASPTSVTASTSLTR